MLRRLSLRGFCGLAVLLIPVVAHSANKTWTVAVSGDFGDPANWSGGVPGAADNSFFTAAGTYSVTFDNNPNPLANPVLNRNLQFSAGDVTFASGSGGPYTYQVTGGDSTAVIEGGALTLGSGGNPLHMTMDTGFQVFGGAMLNINSGSQVNTNVLLLATCCGNGTIIVDSPGAALNASSAIIGDQGNAGTLTYQNSSSGSLGTLDLGRGGTAATGILNVESGANVTTGQLKVGSNDFAATTGIVNIHGIGSTLTQSGSATLSVGGALSIGRINIGTAFNGGTLFTGTGTTTINANGTVTIGEGFNTGTLNANGNVTIDGGTLLRQNAGSAFNLDAGKTMTIQNGGTAIFSGISGYTTAADAIYNITGSGSMLKATEGTFAINNGAAVHISNQGTLSGGYFLNIGTAGNGTLTVDGLGSSASDLNGDSGWGINGNTANVTFSNGANGTFNGISLASDSTAGSTAVVDVLSGANLNVIGGLYLARVAGFSTSATLNVQGSGSTVNQIGGSVLDVGSASASSGVINIGTTSSGAEFHTSTGLFTINKTGTVNVGSGANTGTLDANGDVTIDGGTLTRGSGSAFNLAAGKTMTIQNGGLASFSGGYYTASNAVYNVFGSNSKLEIPFGFLSIDRGAQVAVTSGGAISATTNLQIASMGNGSLSVDGSGSSVVAMQVAQWGLNGNTATVTFHNHATGIFNTQIHLAHSTTAETTATLTIESGADVSAGGLQMAALGGDNVSATLTVDGAGSTMTFDPGTDLVIGHASTGSAVINVQNAGTVSLSGVGTTILNATGTININGGFVELQILDDLGGTINFNYGSLSYLGNLTVGTDGLLGGYLWLGTQHELTLDGATTVDVFRTLTLDGGSLSTGALIVNGTLAFNAGTLSITGSSGLTIGAGGPLGSTFTLGAGRTLNVTNTATINSGALLVLESGGSFNAGTLANNGTVVLDGVAAVLGGATVNNNGLIRGEGTVTASITNAESGEIRAQNGKTLTFAGANGTNAGTINLQGGTAEFSQGLANGSSGQILGRGTLIAGGIGLANSGHVALSSGITDVFGNVNNNTGANNRGITVSGNADVTFWDDVTNVAGSLLRVSIGSSATFFGTFSGAGISGGGDVYFESTVSPGASPALVNFGGDVFLGAAANLNIELGGTAAGSQFDRVEIDGAATLDGMLDVSLIDSFSPGPGDSFEVLHADGGIFGEFADTLLPVLPGGLDWTVVYSNFAVLLQVTAPGLPGDFNFDGTVDAADYVVWRKGQASGDYATWQANFGRTGGSGANVDSVADKNAAAVPEPSTLVLSFVLGIIGIASRSRPRL